MHPDASRQALALMNKDHRLKMSSHGNAVRLGLQLHGKSEVNTIIANLDLQEPLEVRHLGLETKEETIEAVTIMATTTKTGDTQQLHLEVLPLGSNLKLLPTLEQLRHILAITHRVMALVTLHNRLWDHHLGSRLD